VAQSFPVVIKSISGAIPHPSNRNLEDFHSYWAQWHGRLVAKAPWSRRYVQHHNLPEAFALELKPTHEVAISSYDDLDVLRNPPPSPLLGDVIRADHDKDLYDWFVATHRYGPADSITLREAMAADDRQLFDREPGWPLHAKRTAVLATERVIVEGPTTTEMVKMVLTLARLPGLSLAEFSEHWLNIHGALVAELPGLRRYVQNHAIPEAYAFRDMTHDGFAELWFDDFASLQRALESFAWQAVREDGTTLLVRPASVNISRELVMKG
jgi:uncharacterized protein (TIGR02118 family)